MVITCPNCAAGYDVPDHLLAGAGRRLRCARCTQEWQAVAPPGADPAPMAAGAAAAVDSAVIATSVDAPAFVAPTYEIPSFDTANATPDVAPMPVTRPQAEVSPLPVLVPVPVSVMGPDAAASAALQTPSSPQPVRSYFALAIAGWMLSLGMLGSLGWAAVHWRHNVVAVWPPSERAYHAVGLN